MVILDQHPKIEGVVGGEWGGRRVRKTQGSKLNYTHVAYVQLYFLLGWGSSNPFPSLPLPSPAHLRGLPPTGGSFNFI